MDVLYDSSPFSKEDLKDLLNFMNNSFDLDSNLNDTTNLNLNDSYQSNNSNALIPDKNMKTALDVTLFGMLMFIMLGMGCEITWAQLWGHIKRPIGLSIGIVSQFGIKPLAAFAVLVASGVAGLHATGVLIISCCPGGVLSNTFTYFSDGDLPLSVAMTTASTVMAMAMLPANIWLYGRHFESIDLVIPYQKMVVSLLIVTSPICVGMILRWKFPWIAKRTTKIATYIGLILMFVSCGLEVAIFPNMFTSVTPKLYAIILSLPVLGLLLGYGIAAIFRQRVPVCKTIAIECGIQNFPLALTVITLSFPLEMQGEIVLLPWLYGFAMITGSSILCGLYQLHKRLFKRKNSESKAQSSRKEGLDDAEKDIVSKNGVELKSYHFSNLTREVKT